MRVLPVRRGEPTEARGTPRATEGSRSSLSGAVSPLRARALVRGAVLPDVADLEALMAPYVESGDLLPRSNYDLCRHIKEYVVAQAPEGAIVGCGSLKIYSRDLAEIAGLAVRPDYQGAGVGRAVMEALVSEARAAGLAEILALTRKPAFFLKLGFLASAKEHFPLKVWADCARCPRQNCCDEVAVVLKL
jgi:amino-acid N-acetyltransferase